MTEYNGWTNWETWNLALWIDNEEPCYRSKVDFLKGQDPDAASVQGFCVDLFPHGTPDMKVLGDCDKERKRRKPELRGADAMAKVNWVEIAEHWSEEKADL